MAGYLRVAGVEQATASTPTNDAFTEALDMDVSGRCDVAVETTGAATLTVQFSASGDFGGEEFEITVDYSEASEVIEQFDPAHQFVRAKVDANLTTLEVVRRGL